MNGEFTEHVLFVVRLLVIHVWIHSIDHLCHSLVYCSGFQSRTNILYIEFSIKTTVVLCGSLKSNVCVGLKAQYHRGAPLSKGHSLITKTDPLRALVKPLGGEKIRLVVLGGRVVNMFDSVGAKLHFLKTTLLTAMSL